MMLNLGFWELLIILAICGLPLLGIAAAAVVGVLVVKRNRGELRRCPHCAELVRQEAKVCRFCGREIVPPTE
jgi:rRNA maturation endonuclease Nob1